MTTSLVFRSRFFFAHAQMLHSTKKLATATNSIQHLGASHYPEIAVRKFAVAAHNPTEKVFVANPEALAQKIEQIRRAGANQLNMVSDFDHTISKYEINNATTKTLEMCQPTFKVFGDSSLASKALKDRLQQLFNFYYAIELDPKVPASEKTMHMEAWTRAQLEAIVAEGFDASSFGQLVNESNIQLRNHFDKFVEGCRKFRMPFYIVSGGVQDLLYYIFQGSLGGSHLADYPQFQVCSNKLLFNRSGKVVDFADDKIVTSMNKKVYLDRRAINGLGKNAFVFGDIINDSFMTTRAKFDTEIKFGFKNHGKENFNSFAEKFDVVIEGDGNYVVPEFLMKTATNQKVGEETLRKVKATCPELIDIVEATTRKILGTSLFSVGQINKDDAQKTQVQVQVENQIQQTTSVFDF